VTHAIVSPQGQPDIVFQDISVRLFYIVYERDASGKLTGFGRRTENTVGYLPFSVGWQGGVGAITQLDIPLSHMKSLVFSDRGTTAEATFMTQGHEETVTGRAFDNFAMEATAALVGTSDSGAEGVNLLQPAFDYKTSGVTIAFQQVGDPGTKTENLAYKGECTTWDGERYQVLNYALDALAVTGPENQESVYTWDEIRSVRYKTDPWGPAVKSISWPFAQPLVVTLRDGRTVDGTAWSQVGYVKCVRPDGIVVYFRLCVLQDLSLD